MKFWVACHYKGAENTLSVVLNNGHLKNKIKTSASEAAPSDWEESERRQSEPISINLDHSRFNHISVLHNYETSVLILKGFLGLLGIAL